MADEQFSGSIGVAGPLILGDGANLTYLQAGPGGILSTSSALRTDGTDVAGTIQSALDAAGVVGGRVLLPPGTYTIGTKLTIPSGVALEGTSFAGVRTTATAANRGTVLKAKAGTSLTAMVESIDVEGISVRNITLDGQDIATSVLKVGAFQSRIENCEIKRGLTCAINLVPGVNATTHETWIKNNLITQNAMGTGILITGISGSRQCHDNQIIGNVIRGAVVCGVDDDRSGGNLIQANHIYDFPANPTNMLIGVRVTGSGNNTIANNYFDNIAGGPSIRIVGSTDVTKKCRSHIIAGNTFYTSGVMLDNTFYAIELDDASTASSIWDIAIRNNTFNADDTGGNRWKGILNTIGTVPGVAFCGAQIYGGVTVFNGTRPAILKDVQRFTANFGASAALSDNAGTATVTTDGTTQSFATAHGLLGTPRSAVVTPLNNAARNLGIAYNASSNGSNLIIAYQTIPTTGQTLTYSWYAEV